MAEALARNLGLQAQSAGSAPSRVNPYAVRALAELGISTTSQHSKHVDTIDPNRVDLIITLCAEEEFPVLPGDHERLNWSMPDPDHRNEELSDKARLQHFRDTRDALLKRLQALAESLG